jgi:hypothetical protein
VSAYEQFVDLAKVARQFSVFEVSTAIYSLIATSYVIHRTLCGVTGKNY